MVHSSPSNARLVRLESRASRSAYPGRSNLDSIQMAVISGGIQRPFYALLLIQASISPRLGGNRVVTLKEGLSKKQTLPKDKHFYL
ncbi:hypothetical protein TNCV_2838901 [Trichonephila clavipes]|nr:hypothetical protein TNCV_2838901 [Trichonephila clavipes]